jgi:hypothetical protein
MYVTIVPAKSNGTFPLGKEFGKACEKSQITKTMTRRDIK